MRTLAALLVSIAFLGQGADPSAVLESAFSGRELDLAADPARSDWANAPRVTADRNYLGEPIPGPPTEIRSRWSQEFLYLLYICPYDELNLKPDPTRTEETPRLWNWDVIEAFIGSDFEHIGRYKEFQVSPQGEWVDLEIDRGNPKSQGRSWSSGMAVNARIDPSARIWYGVMRIPFAAIDAREPEKGRELRIGLYRIAGTGDRKRFYAWRPTGSTTFHEPKAFGILRLR
jgi:hypothetical protein